MSWIVSRLQCMDRNQCRKYSTDNPFIWALIAISISGKWWETSDLPDIRTAITAIKAVFIQSEGRIQQKLFDAHWPPIAEQSGVWYLQSGAHLPSVRHQLRWQAMWHWLRGTAGPVASVRFPTCPEQSIIRSPDRAIIWWFASNRTDMWTNTWRVSG